MDFNEAEAAAIKIPRKKNDNKYTNYFRNFKFFYEQPELLVASKLNNFTTKFLKTCEVIVIKSWQMEQAIKMFNSLNSDGMPLYDSDIISAQLYQVAKEKNEKNEFKELWEELKRNLEGLKQNKIANIDEILMQQMFYELAKNKEIDVTMPGLRRFYTDPKRGLLKDPIGLCSQLNNLAKIWDKALQYPVIQVLLKFSDNAKRFMASYFHRFDVEGVNEDNIQVIATCLLRLFTLLELVDTGYSSNDFKTFLFKEIVKMADTDISVETIKDDFDTHISRNKNWQKDDIRLSLVDYQKNILVYLNEYLFALENGEKFTLGGKYDIEHIMPQSGTNIEVIRKDAEIGSKEEFGTIANQLGNKIVLEEKINRTLGNDWFRTKLNNGGKLGYKDSSYPMAKMLVKKYEHEEKPFWMKSDIENATNEAADRIVKFIFGE